MWGDDSRLDVVASARIRGSGNDSERLGPAIGYTDPVAGLIAKAVRESLVTLGGADGLGERSDVGVLAVSETATRHTLRQLAGNVSSGRLSPARVAGATAGTLAGLTCIVFGFRGPSLVLTSPPDAVRRTTAMIAYSWLASGCGHVVVCEHEIEASADHDVRVSVLRRLDRR
ncbi:hypothetical protein ACWENQ_44990 [Nonomuraea sp. NPDC004354]